ncbi:MAG: DUF4292 domain-containing protein [Prevotellaceae bacterium]|nr:DUF4292 domain-containing protein [Prevotellaceae bacterium]MDY2633994.1 DUF4292 domain-containing protein [Prevotella sp.]
MKKYAKMICLAAVGLLTACVSQKNVTTGKATDTTVQTSKGNARKQQLTFVQKVSDRAYHGKNIVSKISFALHFDGKDINVGGSIHIRQNEVIRIQLTPMGLVEVGRIELTPKEVLIVDRIHKEYIRASYEEVDFLKRNGLNFSTLQALFYNRLFLPGSERVAEYDLERYDADLQSAGNLCPITLQNDKMNFTWNAEKESGRIVKTVITYHPRQTDEASLTWNYGNFIDIAANKTYPKNHAFDIKANIKGRQKTIGVEINMNKPTNEGGWETRTTLSDKYRKVSVSEVINKIMSL